MAAGESLLGLVGRLYGLTTVEKSTLLAGFVVVSVV